MKRDSTGILTHTKAQIVGTETPPHAAGARRGPASAAVLEHVIIIHN